MNKLNCIRLACVLDCLSPCLDETKYGYPYRQPVLRRSRVVLCRWYPKRDSQIALHARSLARWLLLVSTPQMFRAFSFPPNQPDT